MDGKFKTLFCSITNSYNILGSGSAASGSGLTDINNLFTDAESPVTTGSDGGILTTVTSFVGGLSTPALAGVAAGGGLLLIIIIVLFITASIVLV